MRLNPGRIGAGGYYPNARTGGEDQTTAIREAFRRCNLRGHCPNMVQHLHIIVEDGRQAKALGGSLARAFGEDGVIGDC